MLGFRQESGATFGDHAVTKPNFANGETEMATNQCSHLDQVRDVDPRTPDGCEECLKMGTSWVHLRMCLSCGHIGCCDQSQGKHATKHFHSSNHPIIRSYEPGDDWGWCYVDDLFMEPAPTAG
jgi:uncharacterized UBP type Zn finger protein